MGSVKHLSGEAEAQWKSFWCLPAMANTLESFSACVTTKDAVCCNLSAILLRYKLYESLPSATCSEMNMSDKFLLPQSLREVAVGSNSRNEHVATHATPDKDPCN